LLGSIVFAAPSSNATICFVVIAGIMFAGAHLNGVAVEMGGWRGTLVYGVYYLIPHLEWYDVRELIVHDWGTIDWLACAGATVYALLYSALLLDVTWLLFRRRTLTV
jgi:hypothetical protein